MKNQNNPFLRCGCGATWPCVRHLAAGVTGTRQPPQPRDLDPTVPRSSGVATDGVAADAPLKASCSAHFAHDPNCSHCLAAHGVTPCPACGSEERSHAGYLLCECPALSAPKDGVEGREFACACGNVERQGWTHRPDYCWPDDAHEAGVPGTVNDQPKDAK